MHMNSLTQSLLFCNFLIYLFLLLALLGLHCSAGFSLFAMLGLLIVVTSLVVGHGLWGAGLSVVAAPRLQSTGSRVVAHGLSCSAARRILLDQGSNPCPPHWQVDSLPLRHQGSPGVTTFKNLFLDPADSLVTSHVAS